MLACHRFSLRLPLAWIFVSWLIAPLWAQTRAGDATPVGPFKPLAPIDYFFPSEKDAAVLPGCVVDVGVHDCETQISARVYLPEEIKNDDGVQYPILILLHGNHFTCGRPYDATKDRADLRSPTGLPHIDDDNQFAGLGTCPTGYRPVLSEAGYDYLGTRLASRGYVVVSVDAARGIGGLQSVDGVADPALILARGRLVLRQLETLSEWNSNRGASNPFLDDIDLFDKLDFSQVGMFGHSRGGEGVRAAFNLYSADPVTDWRTLIGPVGFQAIFELAPTDIRNIIGSPVNADQVAWNSLLPGCDGDVETLDGMHPFDRMLKEGVSFDRISTYLVWGANHNFYNNQWQTTDGIETSIKDEDVPAPTCFSPPNLACVDPNVSAKDNAPMFSNSIFQVPDSVRAQQNTAISSVVAFFRAWVDATAVTKRFDANFNPLVGVPGTVTNSNGARRVYPSRCIEREYSRPPVFEEVFEDFSQATGLNSHSTMAMPVPNFRGGATVSVAHSFGVVDLNDPTQRVARIQWNNQNNARLGPPFFQDNWTTGGAGMDVHGQATLDFRIARTINQNVNPGKSTDFSIVLAGPGAGVFTGPVKLSDALAQGIAQLTGPIGEQLSDSKVTFHPYMQTVRIRLSAFPNLARVQRNLQGVRFIFDQTKTGAIFLANITLSPDLGDGIPPTGSIAKLLKAQETSQANVELSPEPMVHPGSLSSIKNGVKVYDIRGIPHTGGIRLELTSEDPLPAGNALLTLRIGAARIVTGNLVDLHHAVFTLTPDELSKINDGDAITLQKGVSERPSQYWDFGTFKKVGTQEP